MFNGWSDIDNYLWSTEKAYVLHTSKADLFEQYAELAAILGKVRRLNIVITDVETFKDEDFETYRQVLAALSGNIEKLYLNGKTPQFRRHDR